MDNNRRGTHRFTCYFCNEIIENETQMGHTAVCSSVLVPCPNKCGSYIARRDLTKHKKECLNRVSRSLGNSPHFSESDSYNVPPTSNTVYSLDRRQAVYPKTDTSTQDELAKLSKKLSNIEQKLNLSQQTSTQNLAVNSSNQNYETARSNYMQLGLEIQKLKYQSMITLEWKRSLESQIDNLKRSLSIIQKARSEADLHWMGLQERMMLIEKQQIDLALLRDAFHSEQSFNRQALAELGQDIESIKSHFSQEHATFATVLNDQKGDIDNLKRDITEIKRTHEEQRAKFTNIIFDIRAAGQIASEAAEKIEIQERDFSKMQEEIQQIKLDLEILEGLTSNNDPNMKSGRCLWKITDVSTKLQKAKDFGSVLKSPTFYTHEYGYKIKILLYLNGLKKWKDRYALLCIHVLKGDYDMLLQWPCHIEGTITLRNLEDFKAKPFSKYITAKKELGDEEDEEPQESSSSYIFIPHSTLFKAQYFKDDILFLDIHIQKNSKIETSL